MGMLLTPEMGGICRGEQLCAGHTEEAEAPHCAAVALGANETSTMTASLATVLLCSVKAKKVFTQPFSHSSALPPSFATASLFFLQH